jgi:hypothetical protein
MGYMNNYGIVSQWYKTLPNEKKIFVRDIFIELLKEKDCRVISVDDLHVEWEFNHTHKEVIKVLKKTRDKDKRDIKSREELTTKEVYLITKREHIEGPRLQAKALTRAIQKLGVGV